PIRIAGIRMKDKYSECGAAFGRIAKRLGRHICGKPMLLHFDREYRESDADFEACMPVRAGKSVDDVAVRELAGGTCVSLLHQGAYDTLGRSYAKILEYVQDAGLEVLVPSREIYHKGPGMIFRGNPKNYLTEIQMLVSESRAGAGSSTSAG